MRFDFLYLLQQVLKTTSKNAFAVSFAVLTTGSILPLQVE